MLPHRKLARIIAEQQGKNRHFAEGEAMENGARPRHRYDYVSGGCRASISRSTRRLEERGLIAKDIFGDVYLPEVYPGDFKRHIETHAKTESDNEKIRS